MAKFGKEKEPEKKGNNIAQIAIILSADGEYNSGIQIVPGNETKIAHLLLCFTNGMIFKSLMKQLSNLQPQEAKKVAAIIKTLVESESEEPLVRPTQFAQSMTRQGDE